MSIRDDFFDAKAIGSLWDVAVSLKRGNPLPIDADSVFESEDKLIAYIGDKITTVAYPGQVVAVVNADSTQIYYIDQNLDYHPVGAKLDADGKSLKVDNNVLKLVGFDEATDGLLAQVKVDAEGNRTLNWVNINSIVQPDGNTTYTFTGLAEESEVYFEVKASDAEAATKIYLDTYSKSEIDELHVTIQGEIESALAEAKKYADDNDSVYDDTLLAGRVTTLENAGHQNAEQVATAISTALAAYYNKTDIDALEEELNGKITAIPKFAIEVAAASAAGTPDVATPSNTTVYLVPDNDANTADVYNEWIHVEIDGVGTWELLGKQTLDLSGYATKEYAEQQASAVDKKYEGIPARVDSLESDVADLKEVDVPGLIETAKQEAIDTAAEAVPVKSVDDSEFVLAEDGKLAIGSIAQSKVTGLPEALANVYAKGETDELVSGAIKSALQGVYTKDNVDDLIEGAVAQAGNNALVKSVSDELTVSEAGVLSIQEIAQSKVAGLVAALNDRYTKTDADSAVQAAIGTAIGSAPTNAGSEDQPEWTGATGIYNNIYTKGEIAALIKNVTGGESAASVLAALNEYKGTNNAAVQQLEKDVSELRTGLDDVNTRIDELTINDIVEDFLILNGGNSSSNFIN